MILQHTTPLALDDSDSIELGLTGFLRAGTIESAAAADGRAVRHR
jgi:hypothetical protein